MRVVQCLILFIIAFANCQFNATDGCGYGQRQLNVINNCNYNIWVGGWWQFYGTGGEGGTGYLLEPSQSTSTCITAPFDGRFWARTGCNFNSAGMCDNDVPCCASGNCVTSSNQFGLICGQPGVPPTTVAEFNMLSWGVAPYQDYYDVSQVDGANVPMQIVPIANTFSPQHLAGNPYWCGTPGCTDSTCDSSFTLKRCPWTYDAGEYTEYLQLVAPTSCSGNQDCYNSVCNPTSHTCVCDSSADCRNGEVCGAASIPGVGLTIACGTPAGWFGAGDACALDDNIGAPLNCNQGVPGQGTNINLYQCTGPNSVSCESNGAGATCCGCPPWEPSGACKNSNPEWVNIAQPIAQIFKDACPTAYSFPYDDTSSTFVCRGTDPNNLVGYSVTFCPAGSPGSL